MSFDPRMPENAQMFIKRIERDNDKIDEIETEILKFLLEVDAKVLQLKSIVLKQIIGE